MDCTSLLVGAMSRSLDAARSFLEQLEALGGRDGVVFAGEFSVSGRVWTAELLLLALDSPDLRLFCAPCCTLLLSRRPGSSSHFEISLFFSPQHLSLSHSLSACLHPLPAEPQRAKSTAGPGGAAHALGSLSPSCAPCIVGLLSGEGGRLRDARPLQATRWSLSLLWSWGGRGWEKRNQEAPLR